MNGEWPEMRSSRRKGRTFIGALVVLVSVVSLATVVRAAEGADSTSTESGYITLFRWLNFALVFGGAGYLIAKKAPPFFRKRAEEIASALTEAAKVKADAERQLAEAEHNLENLDRKVAELRSAAKHEAAAEAGRIRAATQNERAKIDRAADAEIEAAGRAAHSELKAMTAQMAVERAKNLIQQQMTSAAQGGLFHSFVVRLARGAN